MRKPITIRGEEYPSITEAARYYNLSPKMVQGRLRDGWSVEEAFGLRQRKERLPARRRPISVKTNSGTLSYATVKEAAIDHQLDPKVVRTRISTYGWSPEQALGISPPPERKAHNRKAVSFELGGKSYEYESVTHAAKAHDLNEFLVLGRMNARGWTIEQALELDPPPEHTKYCYGYIYLIENSASGKRYVGQTMRDVKERWESHLLSAEQKPTKNPRSLAYTIQVDGPDAFSITQIDIAKTRDELNRLERYWIRKLETMAPAGYNISRGGSGKNSGQPVTVNGITYESVSDAAREHDLKDRLVLDRLRYGWTIEQALDLELPPESHKYSGRSILVNTKSGPIEFDSIGELARHFGLPVQRVMQRLVKLDWTPEQAVDLEAPERWTHPDHALELSIYGETHHFASGQEAAEQYGIKRWSTVKRRINKGWRIEQALGLEAPPPNKMAPKEIEVEVDGRKVIYRTQTEAAKAHNIDFRRVSARRKLGWSWEEALEIISRGK